MCTLVIYGQTIPRDTTQYKVKGKVRMDYANALAAIGRIAGQKSHEALTAGGSLSGRVAFFLKNGETVESAVKTAERICALVNEHCCALREIKA